MRHQLPATETLRQEIRLAEELANKIQARCDAMLDSLGDTDEHGRPILSQAARQHLSNRYDTLVDKELDPALGDVRRLTAELEAEVSQAMTMNPSIHSELLLRMVESLRDPFNTTYNDLWKASVRIEKVTRTPIKVHDTAGTVTRWEGTIRTAGADQEFVAPFSGEYLDGAAAELPAKVDHVLEKLLAGVPFADIELTNARGVRPALAERLGFDSRYFGLPICPHPRLVKIAAHLAVDPERDPSQVATLLGEPVQLVNAVLGQLTSGRPTWERLIAGVEST